MLDSWVQDVRDAARLLRRTPLFALTATLSLAIGIGANDHLHDRECSSVQAAGRCRRADRLVDVGRSRNGQGFDNGSYPNYLDIRARGTPCSQGCTRTASAPRR
jgi:hypothetical protein